MAQPDRFTSDTPTDVTLTGPRATPERGRGATFDNPGDLWGARRTEDLTAIFQSNLMHADNYRLPAEALWIPAYQQYHGMTEDPGKAPWQSQVHVPMSAQAVDLAVSRISSVIFQTEDWFSTRARSRMRDGRAERAKKIVLWQFDKAECEDPLNQSIKDAMICGNGIVKLHVATEVDTVTDTAWKANPPADMLGIKIDMGGKWDFVNKKIVTKRLRMDTIIPTDFWLDPSGMNRWKIQRIKRSLSDVWAMAQNQYADDGKTILRKAIYDPGVVSKIVAGSRDQRLDVQAAIIRNEVYPAAYGDQTVDVYEFWGDLIDPANGVTLYKNIFATWVNKQWMVRKPQRNPFMDGTDPFIHIRAKLLPHQIYGYGLLGQTVKLQAEMDRVLQLIIDKIHLSVPMVEADETAMRNPEQIQGDHPKVVPGKIWRKKGGGDRKIFTPVEGYLPPNEWEIQAYQLLQTAFQMFAQNNEFASGQTLTTNRKTKEEVQARLSAAQQNFNDAAQYIEKTALTPLVNKIYRYTCQFEEDFDNPGLMDLLSDSPEDQQAVAALANMSLAERWNAMRLDTEFEVNGITREVTRQNLLERLQGFITIIEADQSLAMLLDKRWELHQILQAFEFGQEAILPQADAMLQAQQTAMLNAIQNPQPQEEAPGGAPAQGQEGQPGMPGQQMAGQNSHNSRQALAAQARRPPQ